MNQLENCTDYWCQNNSGVGKCRLTACNKHQCTVITNTSGTVQTEIEELERLKSNYNALQEMYRILSEQKCTVDAELKEYKKAEADGLLIRLPADGQIYHIEESEETYERWIGNKPCRYITSEGYWCGWGIGMICFKFSDLGKTIFLTREEAEKALKGGVLNDTN